ncbi:MAG: pre-peptidase C-terminal domain-containing protein, partial [Planctomycetes bacterium]|nr:pre-peptidase C-terminal domain-containing protein [Planctomycetota bacterium]
MTVHTCGLASFDTVLAAYDGASGCPVDAANELACGNDTCGIFRGPGAIDFPVTVGQTYYIRVGGYADLAYGSGNARGFGQIEFLLPPPPPPVPDPPLPGPDRKNRYLSFMPTNGTDLVAYRIDLIDSLDFPTCVGMSKWVGPPDPATGIARLQATPDYRDWSLGPAVIHVGDRGIVPAAIYEMRATADGVVFSDPATITTVDRPGNAFWADCVGYFQDDIWTPADGYVTFSDIMAMWSAFAGDVTGPPLVWVDLARDVPNGDIDLDDLYAVLRAYMGDAYPWLPPCDPCTVSLDCDDGLFCNGTETCVDEDCQPGIYPCAPDQQCQESTDTCAATNALMSCRLSETDALPASSVEFEVVLQDVEGLVAYQTAIEIVRIAGSGEVSVGCPDGVAVDLTDPSFVFTGLFSIRSTDCAGLRAAAMIFGNTDVDVGSVPVTLATYTLDISPEAAEGSVFQLSVLGGPDSLLRNLEMSRIPFAIGAPCMLSLGEAQGNLVVDLVSVQGTPLSGRPLHVEWDVRNAAPVATVEYEFSDIIYLSTDAQWDIGDIRLVSVPHTDPVGPGQSYHAETDVVLPGVIPGQYHILVRTDHPQPPEGHTGSTSLLVGMDELTVGVPAQAGFTEAERTRYYKVTVAEGEDLLISLDDLDDAGANELYLSLAAVPTRSQFDYRHMANFAPDQAIRIPRTAAGTYYILAYADEIPPAVPASYSLLAEYPPLEVVTITPDHGGNTGQVTVRLVGARFTSDTVVHLLGAGGEVHEAIEVYFQDATTLDATFELTGASAGFYDFFVDNNAGATVLLEDVFEVLEGGGPIRRPLLTVPSVTRIDRKSVLYAEVTNTGTTDSFVPVSWLRFPDGVRATLDPTVWPNEEAGILLDFTPSDSSALVLPRGVTVRLPVYYIVTTLGTKTFSLGVYSCPAHATPVEDLAWLINDTTRATHTKPKRSDTESLDDWEKWNCTFTIENIGPHFPTTRSSWFDDILRASFEPDWTIDYWSNLSPYPSESSIEFLLWRGVKRRGAVVYDAAGAYLFIYDTRPWIQVVRNSYGVAKVDWVGSNDSLPFYYDESAAAGRTGGIGPLRAAEFSDVPSKDTRTMAIWAIATGAGEATYIMDAEVHASSWAEPFDSPN